MLAPQTRHVLQHMLRIQSPYATVSCCAEKETHEHNWTASHSLMLAPQTRAVHAGRCQPRLLR
jgi:hypothetical protein